MHSNGRGEETAEPYRGVVLPAEQQPPVNGDHVQPAGGAPWGTPAAPGRLPAQQPEPADATQMLPPYPGELPPPPVPVADATQMLPPYPGNAPSGPGPIPPPPQRPPAPPQAAPGGGHRSPGPPPAEAAQAPALSIFHDDEPQQGQGGGYQAPYDPYKQQAPQAQAQQPYGQQQYGQGSYDQHSYDQQQQYGGGQSYEQQGYQQQGYEQQGQDSQGPQPAPQNDSDYDHLFRNDVPVPEPLRQRIIKPPAKQAQPQYGQPSYEQQSYEPGYDDDGGRQGGGGRKSPRTIIGVTVGGIVVAGLVVGALMSSGGGGGGSSTNVADKSTASSSTKASDSASGGTNAPVGDSAAKQQAQALDSLLNTSGASRSSVVSSVESIKNCRNLGPAATSLRSASAQRTGLVTKLGALAVDKLPNHAALNGALTKAWQASAAADGHYASWADQAAHNGKVCKGGHAHSTNEAQAANASSGTATTQKKHAVKLWNSIAKQYGLTQRQYSQL